LHKFGYEIRRKQSDQHKGLYRPLYVPWESEEFTAYFSIAAPKSLVSRDRCYIIERLIKHTLAIPGDVFECGVYKGGTAALIRTLLEESRSEKKLYLFDTFEGMPDTNPDKDWHVKGDFADTTIEEVRSFVGGAETCVFRKGFIPDTFAGLDDATISFCHIDVDIYKSIIDSLSFVWPRLSRGGAVVFDDYGFPTCLGAREAVDDFFQGQNSVPLCLHTGQAIVFKQ
jgi:O-methyltransferase